MSDILSDWKKLLSDFQSSVSKDLSEIRKHKADIQQMKAEIFDRFEEGHIIRDNTRIILSAPEIIIGNVDASGDLSADGGTVIIKGAAVSLDGVGEKGAIISRAATITQTAVDPGIDGMEEVVHPTSLITSQAKNIVLQSNDSKDCFAQAPVTDDKGIRIVSDTTLDIEAAVSAEKRKKAIESRAASLKAKKVELELKSQQAKALLEAKALEFQTAIQPFDALNASEELTRVNYSMLHEIQCQVDKLLKDLYQDSEDCLRAISELAEVNRQIKALDDESQSIKLGDDFKKNTTKASLTVSAEHIDMQTMDGDGNFKENKEAGIRVNAPRMDVTMQKEDGSLAEKSELNVQVEKVSVSTANPKVSGQNADLPAGGSVHIYSKDINLLAIDAELKDNQIKEKALAKEGTITLRAEQQEISATDTEGNATGAIGINAKAVAVKSMNVDKDKRTDKKLASGSSMLMLSEKMYVGAKDNDNKSKSVQAVSEEIGLFADKTLEVQQDKGKALVQLSGGNTAIAGSKTEIYGATTIQAKTEIKDELKAPKATIDHVEAKSSFKSTNISDGIPVPPPPASAKLSAKLKTEDAPK